MSRTASSAASLGGRGAGL